MSRQLLKLRLDGGTSTNVGSIVFSGLLGKGSQVQGRGTISVLPKVSSYIRWENGLRCFLVAPWRSVCTSCHGSGNSNGPRYSEYKGFRQAAYPAVKGPVSVSSPSDRYDNPITQKLASVRTSEEVLAVLEADADSMDTLSVSVALDVMFDALRSEGSMSTKFKHEILSSVGMQKLCKQLRRRSPYMDPGDIINGIKLLSYLSSPGSHQTLQILLKLLSKHANLMDLQQLAYTQFLLDKFDTESKSSLSKALQIALPMVFESKLQAEIDQNDPHAVSDYMHYASRWKLSEKTVNFLVETAYALVDRFTPQSAKSVIWSLCDIKFENVAHAPLISACYQRLSTSLESMKLIEVTTTASKAARKYNKRTSYFYKEDFMDAYCERLCQPDVDTMIALWSMKDVSIFRHLNIEYVDHVGDIIAANPSYILNNDQLFNIFVKSISNFNYKPEKWSSFSSILLEHPSLTKTMGTCDVNLTVDFLVLDMFPETLIRTLFSNDGLDALQEFQNTNHPITLIMLYNAIKVLHPKYKGPLPPITMIENWKELARASNARKSYPLKSALQSGLGGESYVINGLYHDGLHIDHGIVMRKGGYPVAVNSQIDSQSDCLHSIAKPPESVIVLVKACTRDLYANNTKRMRGMPALELKILESLGHPLVLVNLEQWLELPDHEKIPYLMQKIREKTETLQWNQNWGDVIPP